MANSFDVPASAVCPDCGATVALPAACPACGAEVPDASRDYVPPAPPNPQGFVLAPPATETPESETPETEDGQRYSRRNLFRSLGGLVAEKGIERIEEVKSRFSDEP